MDQLGESIRKLLLAGIGAAAVTKEKGEEVLHLVMVDDAIPAGAKLE